MNAMNATIASTRIVKTGDEYVVKAYGPNGERIPDADYFTSDRADAKETARLMVDGATSRSIQLARAETVRMVCKNGIFGR